MDSQSVDDSSRKFTSQHGFPRRALWGRAGFLWERPGPLRSRKRVCVSSSVGSGMFSVNSCLCDSVPRDGTDGVGRPTGSEGLSLLPVPPLTSLDRKQVSSSLPQVKGQSGGDTSQGRGPGIPSMTGRLHHGSPRRPLLWAPVAVRLWMRGRLLPWPPPLPSGWHSTRFMRAPHSDTLIPILRQTSEHTKNHVMLIPRKPLRDVADSGAG